jgi:integrase
MHRVLSLALKAAVKPPFSLIAFNPADYVSLPRKSKKERLWLTDETMQVFLDVLDTDKYGLMFEFALVAGMRPEEYLALKWTDIDFTQSTAAVNRTLTRRRKAIKGEQNWKFEYTKNESSRRLVPLPRYLMPKLLEHKRRQNEQRLMRGKNWQDNNLIFCSSIGTPLNLANIQFRHYKPLLKKVGLERMRLYDLRHSFASLLLKVRKEPGKPAQPAVPLKVVSEMLGHNDPYTTARFYQHVDESMKRQASDTMESIVSGRR